MHFKTVAMVPPKITKADAFGLYARHAVFRITKSQRALSRLEKFKGILVEKALLASTDSRSDGGVATFVFNSATVPFPITFELAGEERAAFRKTASSQLSMIFTKQGSQNIVAPPTEREEMAMGEEAMKYVSKMRDYRESQKENLETGVKLSGAYALLGTFIVGACMPFSLANFSHGYVAIGAAFSLIGLGAGAYFFHKAAKYAASSLSQLADQIKETVSQLALLESLRREED